MSDTEMFYDIRGNIVRKEQYLPKETITTRYEYDSSSNLIQQVNGVGTPEQITTTFIYNSFGELAKTEYTDGTSKHHSYDAIGRLSNEWSNNKSVHYSYKYNQQDLITEAENCKTQKKTVREYSAEGNLLSEHFENGLKIGYCYDRLNRVTERIYPDGSSIKQIYNPIFISKTERLKNDAVVYNASFENFDLSGKPEKVVFPKKSGALSIKYDKLSRPKRLTSHHYKEKDILYDSRGLLTSKIVNDDLQTFEHDHLQQLTLEKTSEYSHTYENDALNRQISVDGRIQIHNAVHQLTHGVHSKYFFDTKGRRISDSSKVFTYNKFDHLIKIHQGDLTWSYTYDAFHRKMSRTFGEKTVYYLYEGHEEIGSYDNEFNNLDLKVLSAGEGSIPIAIELGSQNYSPLLSSQGHIVGLVEMQTGKLADRSYLTMFGEDLASNPLSPWRFCGKRHETSELGLIDFGFRFYHPKSAQWLTQDPIGETDGPNLYAYVRNSPTCYIDRHGLFMDGVDFSTSWSNLKKNWSWAESQVMNYSWMDKQLDNQVVNFGDGCASFLSEQGDTLGSLALDCTPVVGSIKSACEVVLGTALKNISMNLALQL
ncbi:MAG: RHS repeat-associated core domain-containing protein [Parachlamydiaceae bacterium]|nr:RHS repeat-associated core domain-containing protein [Parachlamydiaceae bacterium]